MRILIAEDDLTAQTILIGIMKKWGYEVDIANNGMAAWKILQQPDPPMLVIMDWMMPGMDGIDVIRAARAAAAERPLYIILITSRDRKGDILTGLEAGANDYIKKPFVYEELFARIRVGQRTIELQASLYDTQKALAKLAIYDTLTGILNRRGIIEHLSKEYSRARRGDYASDDAFLSVGFLDIDKFKNINDQFGHKVGDEVLQGLVELVASQLRAYDVFGRLGGDEFLVIAPGTDQENSQLLFERLARSIAQCTIKTSSGELSVTASIGIKMVSLKDDVERVLDYADAAMYNAKRAGGNRVSVGQLE